MSPNSDCKANSSESRRKCLRISQYSPNSKTYHDCKSLHSYNSFVPSSPTDAKLSPSSSAIAERLGRRRIASWCGECRTAPRESPLGVEENLCDTFDVGSEFITSSSSFSTESNKSELQRDEVKKDRIRSRSWCMLACSWLGSNGYAFLEFSFFYFACCVDFVIFAC